MNYFLKLSVVSLGFIYLTGCALRGDKPIELPIKNSQPAVNSTMEESPLPEAREALLDEQGEILSDEINMWRNRDKNSNSRS